MLLYVTKWVIARGILLVEGSTPHRCGRSKNLYSSITGVGRRMSKLGIGREAFYTLKEARENARIRFEVHCKRARAELTKADLDWKRIQKGDLVQVHKKPEVLSKCRPFTVPK